jgi:hypothetical protein
MYLSFQHVEFLSSCFEVKISRVHLDLLGRIHDLQLIADRDSSENKSRFSQKESFSNSNDFAGFQTSLSLGFR